MENYLKEVCFAENPEVLDDDMPDFFERWLERKDKGDILEYIVEYDNKMKNAK